MRVAFVPSAPLLLLDAGPAELRTAVASAVAWLEGDVVVVGAASRPGWWTGQVDRTAYGVVGEPAEDPLPLPLAVGVHLVPGARCWGVPAEGLPEADSYLVVADGTAKRTLKAPGHLDPRAEAFDAEVTRALAGGDAAALAALDDGLAAELWVAGLDAWRAVSRLRVSAADLLYADAPYGVGYAVATWTADR